MAALRKADSPREGQRPTTQETLLVGVAVQEVIDGPVFALQDVRG